MTPSAPAEQDTPLSQKAARILLWVEKYPLPLLYGWLAWQRWEALRVIYREYSAGLLVSARLPPGWQNLYYAGLAKSGLLCVLMVFTGLTLLLNRAPSVLPDKLKHVVVPLAASYYFVLYGLVDKLPREWVENLAPRAWRPSMILAGVLCSAAGYVVTLWALCYLRRSFAVMVAVRQVVLGGPYAYVRHPMYLGYPAGHLRVAARDVFACDGPARRRVRAADGRPREDGGGKPRQRER